MTRSHFNDLGISPEGSRKDTGRFPEGNILLSTRPLVGPIQGTCLEYIFGVIVVCIDNAAFPEGSWKVSGRIRGRVFSNYHV